MKRPDGPCLDGAAADKNDVSQRLRSEVAAPHCHTAHSDGVKNSSWASVSLSSMFGQAAAEQSPSAASVCACHQRASSTWTHRRPGHAMTRQSQKKKKLPPCPFPTSLIMLGPISSQTAVLLLCLKSSSLDYFYAIGGDHFKHIWIKL